MILIDKLICNKGESRSAFQAKVEAISEKLGINPNWLMVVMYNESRLNAQAVNKQKGDTSDSFQRAAKRATGLIQFMPKTAEGLGTSTQKLYQMTNMQQLDYVYKYFQNWKGKIKSYFDLYMITFFPIAVGKDDDFVIQSSKLKADIIAKQNPGLDINKDNKITVGEAKKIMLKAIPQQYINDVLTIIEKKNLKLE